ncbi:hypothetical protein MWT96_20785 [Prescottella equi]|uniref:hypothetical protein n=1 Tax=Rhodococcus hoagii TaxID=43767 RepID=UPI00197F9003|nr:hypothetical protein [Prescottella equi]MBM4497537.1 hypothetical protein [Prescottella equi]MBM4655605.1 hypothetical protein [Prescottella equi]MBM4718801.1 hypothetical protein [Prescottella equi]MBP0080264.1 hypothetical protein [Prescottella equi]MBP0091903.1 hypothetical protein [Prescottella equi]
MTEIVSPVAGFTGDTVFGTTTIHFKDGVAEAKDVPEGVLAYLRSRGFTVDGKTIEQPAPPAPVDSREVTEEQVGTKVRDAAVDPRPEDFLAPVNAGKADPHGPKVVSPEVHATPEQVVRPGKVSGDAKVQDKAESDHAAEVLQGEPIAFDPTGHDVDEVNAYLDGADAAERERVLQAEADGKARKGILSGPHADSPKS